MESEKYAQNVFAYIVGFAPYAVLLLGALFGETLIVIAYVRYLPGILFAGFILLFTPGLTLIRALSFASICCVLYYGEFNVLIRKHFDRELSPYYYPAFGMINAVIIACTHSLLFKKSFTIKRDVFIPIIIGLFSSIVTFIFSQMVIGLNPWAPLLHGIGFYSIFPLWTIAMSRHLLAPDKYARND